MTPPHKQDIEYYTIASLLTNPRQLDVLPLKEEHFYCADTNLAYKTMRSMRDDGEEINLVTFGGRYHDAGGKISAITSVLSDFSNVSDIYLGSYLKQLAEELAKRKIHFEFQNMENAPLDFIAKVKKIEMDFIHGAPKSVSDLHDEYMARYKEKKERSKTGGIGVITGFKAIDNACPLEPGALTILAAKTSIGKTALALNISVNSAMFGHKVLFFSAEMGVFSLMDRMYAQLSDTSSTKFKYANADAALALVKNEVNHCGENIKFIEANHYTSEDICRVSHQQSSLFKPDLVVVDYIQYLRDEAGKSGTNNDRIGKIVRNLKGLSIELGCSVLALSQVSRAADGIPQLHHLRDSGNLEQDADVVLILHRDDRDSVDAKLVIAKNREGMADLKQDLKYKPSITKFYE